MADFFAPMSDIQSDVMRPIDPLLLVEDGYAARPYQVGLGAAPTDALFPSDAFTPVENIYGPPGHEAALGGLPDMLDVFNAAKFLFGE